jgi:hypothetical protein
MQICLDPKTELARIGLKKAPFAPAKDMINDLIALLW